MKSGKISLTYGMRWKRIFAVILLIIYQLIGQVVLSSLVIHHAETMSIERLADAARSFSQNFYQHAMSDREQLRVVADMTSMLMRNGHTDHLDQHLSALEQRGMLDWFQLLLPDGQLITGNKTIDVSDQISFENEAARLPYISNISPCYVDTHKRVIRSAVAVKNGNEIVAILYGVYDLTANHKLEGTTVFDGQSYTFVMETDTGNYLLDDLRGHDTIGKTNSTYEAKRGYDLDAFAQKLYHGEECYTSFHSLTIDDYMYLYSVPIGINSWTTMISVPEGVALRYAYESRDLMLGSLAYTCLGVLIYFIAVYAADQKLQRKNQFVNGIQAQLMEVYHKPEYYTAALTDVAKRARSQALFLVNALHPEDNIIVGDNQAVIADYQKQDVLIQDMLILCQQHRKSVTIRQGSRMLGQHPHVARFLQAHHLKSVALVPVLSADGTIHQIFGAFAPENPDVLPLLNTVSVSFLMAASSMDYLDRLEIASTVDGLTGVMNRASYHLRLDDLTARKVQGFGCVYIDVNDLHAINNRFGHEKGDAMLRCISSALRDTFGLKNVFRFGGDEFVILIENITSEWLSEQTRQADEIIRSNGYTVSIGTDWAEETTEVPNMIRNAEASMYKAKYLFYQEKQKQAATPSLEHKAVRRLLTENTDVNDFLEVAEHHYRGVYVVNLATDEVREIFARHYFYNALQVSEKKYSVAFQQYIAEVVDKQSRRNIQNFFDYHQINEQIAHGSAPTVEYTKADGERIRLTVHRSPRYTAEKPESLWVFETVGG